MDTEKIDFVLTWVDGNDKKWQEEKAKYTTKTQNDNRINRYRDWKNLQYWFRGIEKFAPWVHKIYFITYGHLPEWLNTKHSKLEIIKHTDFIPEKYLPTFNVNPIEMNFHRIEGLSEQFVYFNDDMFIIKKVLPEDFFKGGLPRDHAILHINCVKHSWQIQKICNNDIGIINEEFDFRKSITKNITKWFNPKYGIANLKNIWLYPCPRFPGIYHEHANGNYLKSVYEQVWDKYYSILDQTSKHKFRTEYDVNQWLIKDWQIASGKFIPQRKISKFIDLKNKENFEKCLDIIVKQKIKVLCINDAENIDEEDFEVKQKAINEAFEKILPNKSQFEI